MNTKLIVKKFKKITDEIVLNNFAYINYFVGENGSGKTSILNSLSFLKDGENSRHFFGPESVVKFSNDEKSAFLFWNSDNPNKTEHRGDLDLNIHILISNIEQEKGANNLKGKANLDSRIGIGDSESLNSLNLFFEEIGHQKLVARKFVDQTDPFNQDNGKLIFENKDGVIDPTFIADGLRAKHNLKKTLTEWVSQIKDINTINIFIIEEPENNLHPNFQKEIPVLLNSIFEDINPDIAKTIFFFISTHSPFIISKSAEFLNQKVYPLKNGKPLKIDFQTQSWIEVNESNGYGGSECAYVVSKMLGADINDIGYPENYCLLEEYSMQIILDDAREKGIIKNIQFVSTSGVSKTAEFSESIYELEKINTLIKCNPYYFDKYYIIIDNLQAIEDNRLKIRLDKIKNKLQGRFIELELHSLEDYYSNLDPELAKLAKDEIEASEEKNKGRIKATYANKIIEKIIDKESFSKLFDTELDFLLQ